MVLYNLAILYNATIILILAISDDWRNYGIWPWERGCLNNVYVDLNLNKQTYLAETNTL